MKHFTLQKLFLLSVLNIFSLSLFTQNNPEELFEYLSPQPNSMYVSPENNIAIRLNSSKVSTELMDISISLEGSKSRMISGTKLFSSDQKTIIFKPSSAFKAGEKITVKISDNLPNKAFNYSYSFTVSTTGKKIQKRALNRIHAEEDLCMMNQLSPTADGRQNTAIPEITITHSSDPSPGKIFFATIGNKKNKGSGMHLIMVDNEATPVFYRETESGMALDFKLQPTGFLTYYNSADSVYDIMNEYFKVIGQVNTGNGYIADRHELLYLENGHCFMMAYDPQVIDMSEVVPGGQEDAIVIGLIVQELDTQKHVIFQWRSWDHFQITDASDAVNLTADLIDYVHGNAIEVQSDTSLLISSRNLDEITKIDRRNASVVWRLNGKANMFAKPPSADMFCKQHDVRMMPGSSNHISVFDNGNCHTPKYSSAAEYIVDEENMSVSLVKRLRSTPDIYGPFMGNAQRLLNGHTLVGWGAGIPNITEFDEEGNIRLQLSFNYMNYRAFKFEWDHSVMSVDQDTLNFETVLPGDSAIMQFSITNNLDIALAINNLILKEEAFEVLNNLPVQIQPQASKTIKVLFKPDSTGDYASMATFCWDSNNQNIEQRISKQVYLKGKADDFTLTNEINNQNSIRIYPNPFGKTLRIEAGDIKISEVQIINNLGQSVFERRFEKPQSIQLHPEINPGIYIIKIKTIEGVNMFSKIIHH